MWKPIMYIEGHIERMSGFIFLIHMRPTMDGGGFINNIYGPSWAEKKYNFLDSLGTLRTKVWVYPWILGGYFHLVRILDKKKGGI